MTHFHLDITLLDGVTFSRDGASVGEHSTIDRVPGANLWGLVCGGLYAAADPLANTLAHGGLVHFGDGYPVSPGGAVAWPAPLSLHHDKTALDGPWHQDGLLVADRVHNGLHADLGLLGQARAVRNGYVSQYGEWVVPGIEYELSTAVGSTREAGSRAEENSLHGQSSLRRHLRFRAEIVVTTPDADLAAQLAAALVAYLGPLDTQREIVLGRGRGAHFGRARVVLTRIDPDVLPSQPAEGRLALWLLSDACLRDAFGQPVLCPDPQALGLTGELANGLVLDPSRSFVRHRSHSAYNRHRACFGLQRHCLEAGSVLSFIFGNGDGDAAQAIRDRLRNGIGTLPELGFGRVWVDPPLLSDVKPRFDSLPSQPARVAAASSPQVVPQALHRSRNISLVEWASATAASARIGHARADWIASQLAELQRLLRQSRRYAGIDDALPHGPGRSQWGLVEQIVRDATSEDAARRRLFDAAHGVLVHSSSTESPWLVETGDGRLPTPAEWWRARLDDAPGSDWGSRQQSLCLLAAAARGADVARLPAADAARTEAAP